MWRIAYVKIGRQTSNVDDVRENGIFNPKNTILMILLFLFVTGQSPYAYWSQEYVQVQHDHLGEQNWLSRKLVAIFHTRSAARRSLRERL